MSCRIDQYSVLIESSSTKACANMSVSLTNLSREGKCIKSSVYLIYQIVSYRDGATQGSSVGESMDDLLDTISFHWRDSTVVATVHVYKCAG